MTKIIAIDGPSGVGKSSVSKALADKLNYNYVDTGAIYRTIALIAYNEILNNNIGEKETAKKKIEQNMDKLISIINKKKFVMTFNNHSLSLFLDNYDVSESIRSENISTLSSVVSQFKEIRDALLDLQRDLAINTDKLGSIIDGRDIGTVVFPQADVKIFLTASSKERAKRRYKELLNKGLQPNYDDVLNNIIKRDDNDTNRPIAPLKKAKDALEFNTDDKDFDEVLSQLKSYILKIN